MLGPSSVIQQNAEYAKQNFHGKKTFFKKFDCLISSDESEESCSPTESTKRPNALINKLLPIYLAQ